MNPCCQRLEKELSQTRLLLAKAIERIQELEECLNKNSQNSSKPPSQDQKKSEEPPRKGGAKAGHKGNHRQMLPPEEVDSFQQCVQKICPCCGSEKVEALSGEATLWQQVEIPTKIAYVTQYERKPFCCTSCGHEGVAALPKGVEESAFGPRLKSLITTCTGNFHLSKRETQALLSDFLAVRLSLGSVSNIEGQIAKLLQNPYKDVSQAVLKGKVVHLDETGWRESAQNHFVWVAACANAVFYRIDPKRNREARDKVVGKDYHQPTVTDRFGVYNDLTGAHQYCLAHFKRELKRFSERNGYDGQWGIKAIGILDCIFQHWALYRRAKISRSQLKKRCLKPRSELKDLLIVGGWYESQSSPKLRRFCKTIFENFDRLWTFLRVECMEPTNNQAERDLRKIVLWRKKSFGTKSNRGQRFVERIKTVAMTLQRQKQSLFFYLTSVFQAAISGRKIPSPAMG
jgi:transposase